MDLQSSTAGRPDENSYLFGRGSAWFAFAMTIGLMVFDYVDRQVIVSIFPHLKAAWGLSDKQLGALVSVVSITVALGGIPIALVADRFSRVRSIAAMAIVWCLATISCMFTRNYAQLFTARAIVGAGEAGYGSVGAALISAHFPARMRGVLMSAFFASASIGSVLGVLVGGLIAEKWGWQAAFGVVGIPGLAMATLYLFVRDYKTVELTPSLEYASHSVGGVLRRIFHVLARSRTLAWVCVAGAAQCVVISAVWAWTPSFLNRVQGLDPATGAKKAALVVLLGAIGCLATGYIVDRASISRPLRKFSTLAALCVLTCLVLCFAYGATRFGLALSPQQQFALIGLGAFLMTCTAGPVAAIVMNVVHPGVRSTGASVLSLVQNLFGLAAGPFIAGALSDAVGLELALTIVPAFGLLAAGALMVAARSYEADKRSAGEPLDLGAASNPLLGAA
ncbi:MAG: MFS transporter [Hyphomicrobiales bacterium]|nr:MFS transporter [Hyphomicrobiales bacterium]